ncbi:Wzz/FepE/Etk N-terminal domain-containing protein [Pelagibacterium sp. H642]|uniref:GumC family protein n=1 Tax=Pelagibacterium sp. H642 TaxID=1881069 RepID=UPI00281692FD|nr:Wzz/FepE/Etk N-terminal domain-containing protein [Pelagibacterium sp. H642]WMT92841.1 Wzz/FepE/Etk N-terminal domain-containing protein [Pelagibacterium sp. H642]
MGSIDLRFYLLLLLRRLPLIAVVVAIPTFGALSLALFLQPVYRSTALVMVVSPRIPEDMAQSTVSDTAVARFRIIERELMMVPSLLALAEQFQIYGEERPATPIATADDMRSRIDVEQFWLDPNTPAAPAFAISFEAGDGQLAASVANHLATSILAEDNRRRTEAASETMAFFRQNVDELAADLSSVEERILEFRNLNLNALPDSLDFRRGQQNALQERLLVLEREEAALRSRRFNLALMFESTRRLPSTATQTPEGQALAALHSALVTQQALYTDDSPSIQALQEQISRLQETAADAHTVTDEGHPVPISEVDVQVAEIDDQLELIAREKVRIAETLEVLTNSIAATPENETVMNDLLRERENLQIQYNAAVGRLAQASTGEQVESDLKGERLVMLEEAVAPTRPTRPRRTMIVFGGFALGLGLATALVVMLEFLNNGIRRPVDLRRVLNMEPLMTIPYITTRRETAARRAMVLVAVGLFAIAIPAGLVVSAQFGLPVGTSLSGPLEHLRTITR